MTIIPFLLSSDKDFRKIQQIIILTKAVNIIKQTISQIANLIMIAKKKQIVTNSLKN